MKKYDDNLEKNLTAVFGALGTIAIVINLFLKGWTPENLLDGMIDMAGLVVVIAVFLIANKLFRRDVKHDFPALFEQYLKEWINQNNYLVDDNFDEEGKGKFKKRFCNMMIDHTNIIKQSKFAKDAAPRTEKAAFAYLPYEDENGILREEFEFRFNEKTFQRQDKYFENGKVKLSEILDDFTSAIIGKFKILQIRAKANPSSKTITVFFNDMEKNEENAKQLISMVEYVKTMVLATA